MRRFAHVQDMDKAATTLVFSFSMGLRLQSKAALGLAVSRLIEERVGLAEGMADVRKWLLIIGELTDDELAPLIALLHTSHSGQHIPSTQASSPAA